MTILFTWVLFLMKLIIGGLGLWLALVFREEILTPIKIDGSTFFGAILIISATILNLITSDYFIWSKEFWFGASIGDDLIVLACSFGVGVIVRPLLQWRL